MGRNCYAVQLILPKLVAVLMAVFVVNVSLQEAAAQHDPYCSAYCDVYDNLVTGFYCTPDHVHVYYCCGTTYNKTCCTDMNAEIDVPDETICGHSWIYYQWSLIYGLVAVLMVILMIVICCICCRGYQIVSRRNTAASATSRRQERGETETDAQSTSLGFDPSCEYAFEPPRYETLPKDPPKYSEVFSDTTTTTGEHENAGFATDEQPVASFPATTTSTTMMTMEEQPISSSYSSPAASSSSFSSSSSSSCPSYADTPLHTHGGGSSSSSPSTAGTDFEAESRSTEMVAVMVEEDGNEPGDTASTSSL